MITVRSSNSLGIRLRRSPLGLRGGRGSRRRQFQGSQGSRTGSNTVRCLKPLYVRMVGTALLPGRGLLVPESRRVVPGFLIKSLSDHYNSAGRLAEYKRPFQRAHRCLADDPSIFAIELETLARRALIDIDPLIQLQMARDRFIDGQAECALRRHLDSGRVTLKWKIGNSREQTDTLRMRYVR